MGKVVLFKHSPTLVQANRNPHFQADQSWVVVGWNELSHHPKQTRLCDEKLRGLIKMDQTGSAQVLKHPKLGLTNTELNITNTS